MQVLFKKENQKFVLIVAFTPFLQDGEDPTEWVLYKFAGTKKKKISIFKDELFNLDLHIFLCTYELSNVLFSFIYDR